MNLVCKREAARRAGCEPSTISRAIRQGRLRWVEGSASGIPAEDLEGFRPRQGRRPYRCYRHLDHLPPVEAAKQAGITPSAMRSWRRAHPVTETETEPAPTPHPLAALASGARSLKENVQ